MQSLTAAQREVILSVLTEVRERYMSVRTADGAISPEQCGSYIHTIGELSECLESAKANGLSGGETMNAALAAMLSDSSKAGWNRESNGNFFSHHLDAALAAEIVLSRYLSQDFTTEDLEAIRHSILEHQIGPPSFMAFAYTKQIREQLNEQTQKRFETLLERERQGQLSADSQTELQRLKDLQAAYEQREVAIKSLEQARTESLNDASISKQINLLRERQKEGVFVSDEEAVALANIHKMIANPFESETEPDFLGGVRLKFGNMERSLLYKYVGPGTQNWHVPNSGNSWDRVSRVVISADSFDNYYPRAENGVAVKGPFKIAALRGPLSVTPDNHIDAAIASLNDSEQSTLRQGLFTPADVERAKVRMSDDHTVYADAKARTELWIREQLNLARAAPLPDIPYWNSKLELPGANATAEERAAFRTRPEVEFGQKIQLHFADELLRMRRFSDDVPQSFESVRGESEGQLLHRADAAERDAALVTFQQFIDVNVPSDRAWGEISKSLDQFNERAHLAGMSARTYRECLERVKNILQSNDASAIHLRLRQELAEEALWLLANPTFTAQGNHYTCGPSCVEVRNYIVDPVSSLKIIEDIAIRGEFVCPDGSVLRPYTYGGKFEFARDAEARTIWRTGMPDDLEFDVSTTRGGRRLAVSQIFQDTFLSAVFDNYSWFEGKNVGAGNIRVLADQVVDPSNPHRRGEIMVDASKNPPEPLRDAQGQIIEFKGLNNGRLFSGYKKLFGKEDLVILQKGAPPSAWAGEISFQNEQDLFTALQNTKLPAIFCFDVASTGRLWHSGDGGGHYIGLIETKTASGHIGAPTAETLGVRIDNQWERDGQTVIPLTELATMTNVRWDIKRQQMVRDRIAAHPEEIEARLEMVRLQLETERQRRFNDQLTAWLQAQGKPLDPSLEEFRNSVDLQEHCTSPQTARDVIAALKHEAERRKVQATTSNSRKSELWDGSSLPEAMKAHEELRFAQLIARADQILKRADLLDLPPPAPGSAGQPFEEAAENLVGLPKEISDDYKPAPERLAEDELESEQGVDHKVEREQTQDASHESAYEDKEEHDEMSDRLASVFGSLSSCSHEDDEASEELKVDYRDAGTVAQILNQGTDGDTREVGSRTSSQQEQNIHGQDLSERIAQYLKNENLTEQRRRDFTEMNPEEQLHFLNQIQGRANLEAAFYEHARLEALRRERLFPSLDSGEGRDASFPGDWNFPDLSELGDSGLENLLKHRLNEFKNHPFNDTVTMERFYNTFVSVLPRWLPEVNEQMTNLHRQLLPLEIESQTIENRLTCLHDELLKSELAVKEGSQRYSDDKLESLRREQAELTERLVLLDKQATPLRAEFGPLLERRRQMMEESLNAFAIEQGLPSIRLRVDKPLPSDASATFDTGTGDIFLRESNLCDPGTINIGTMYHELLHSEQDAVVLRNAMLDAWRASGGKLDLDEFYAFGRAQVFKFYKESMGRRFDDVSLSPERFSEIFPVAQDATKLQAYEDLMLKLGEQTHGDINLTNALAKLPQGEQLRYKELHRIAQLQSLHERQMNWIKERESLTEESLANDRDYSRARSLADSLKPEMAVNSEFERFNEIGRLIVPSSDLKPQEFIARLISDPSYQEKIFGYELLHEKFADAEFEDLLYSKHNFAETVLTYKFDKWSDQLSDDARPRFARARIRLMLKALVFMNGRELQEGGEFDSSKTIEITRKLLAEALYDAGDGASRRKWKDYLSNNWEFEANLAGNTLNHLFKNRIAEQLQAQTSRPEAGTREYYTNLLERYQESKNASIGEMNHEELITEYERVLHERYELERIARLDDMTGLPNKPGMHEYLEHEIKKVERKNSSEISLSVMAMDFDGFKPVNDNLGHEYGDQCIKSFADWLKQTLRTSDIPGRFGGDEFALILPNTIDPTALLEKIRSLRLQVSPAGVEVLEPGKTPEGGADVFVVGVSVGAATWGKDATDANGDRPRAEQLFKIADARQLVDKNERKALARQGVHPESMSETTEQQSALEKSLSFALRFRDVVGRKMPTNELSVDTSDLTALRDTIENGRKQNYRLIQNLIHDPLTGLYNKAESERALDRTVRRFERLARENEAAGAAPPKLKAMMMDVDGLKPINDTFGHDAGDKLLRIMGARLQGCTLNEKGELVKIVDEYSQDPTVRLSGFRNTDTLARLGGDEFKAIMPDCEDVTRLLKELQDFRVAVGMKDGESYVRVLEPNEKPQAGELMSGISIGISDWVPGRSAKEMAETADLDLLKNKELREELGLRIPRPKEMDRSGRALEKKNPLRISDQFKPLTELEKQVARTELERDMREYKGVDGKSVLDQLKTNENLTDSQKTVILDVLSEMRERYNSIRESDDSIDPDQKGSYLHTIGELSEVMDSARANGLDGRETQNAALAAMLSDSSKSGWSPEQGGNFFTHHLDGALAAEVVLSRYIDENFTSEDLTAISHAILEHQIGPPRFMAERYTELIRSGLNKRKEELYNRLEPSRGRLPEYLERELERLTKLKNDYELRQNLIDTTLKLIQNGEPVYGINLKELQTRQREGRFVSEDDSACIEHIRKMMAEPLSADSEEDPLGGYRLKFSAKERSLLARYVALGTENWHVPNDKNRWNKISRVVISADSFDNYFPKVENGAPVKGPFKIAALRGPDKFPPDNCLDSAIAALKESETITLQQKLFTEADEVRALERMKDDDAIYAQARAGTERWLRATLGLSAEENMSDVVYWNSRLELPKPNASQAEKDEFFSQPEVKLAIAIQQHFAGELLSMRRFDNGRPADFRSVRGKSEEELESRRREASGERAEVRAVD
jgi:diguanylate cyclase (GGDEF)-like protein